MYTNDLIDKLSVLMDEYYSICGCKPKVLYVSSKIYRICMAEMMIRDPHFNIGDEITFEGIPIEEVYL